MKNPQFLSNFAQTFRYWPIHGTVNLWKFLKLGCPCLYKFTICTSPRGWVSMKYSSLVRVKIASPWGLSASRGSNFDPHSGWVFYTYPPPWWSIPYTVQCAQHFGKNKQECFSVNFRYFNTVTGTRISKRLADNVFYTYFHTSTEEFFKLKSICGGFCRKNVDSQNVLLFFLFPFDGKFVKLNKKKCRL